MVPAPKPRGLKAIKNTVKKAVTKAAKEISQVGPYIEGAKEISQV
jgi:hypothetical protein